MTISISFVFLIYLLLSKFYQISSQTIQGKFCSQLVKSASHVACEYLHPCPIGPSQAGLAGEGGARNRNMVVYPCDDIQIAYRACRAKYIFIFFLFFSFLFINSRVVIQRGFRTRFGLFRVFGMQMTIWCVRRKIARRWLRIVLGAPPSNRTRTDDREAEKCSNNHKVDGLHWYRCSYTADATAAAGTSVLHEILLRISVSINLHVPSSCPHSSVDPFTTARPSSSAFIILITVWPTRIFDWILIWLDCVHLARFFFRVPHAFCFLSIRLIPNCELCAMKCFFFSSCLPVYLSLFDSLWVCVCLLCARTFVYIYTYCERLRLRFIIAKILFTEPKKY